MGWHYESKNVERAKTLRKAMTPQERKLWYCFLKCCSFKFYRQRPIGPYIVDFYCASANLVVEVDGGQHYETREMQYDAGRTKKLEEWGIRVLRFTNTQVDREFEAVKAEIGRLAKAGEPAQIPGASHKKEEHQ